MLRPHSLGGTFAVGMVAFVVDWGKRRESECSDRIRLGEIRFVCIFLL